MLIVAIDPGTTVSAYIEWDGSNVHHSGIVDNYDLLDYLKEASPRKLFVEQLSCMGGIIGREILDTAMWSGRFVQCWDDRQDGWNYWRMVPRTTIKKHHKAKNDAEMRAVMIQKYGHPGTKKQPGRTYGLKSHLWQAFALATYVTETQLNFPSIDG